MMKLLTFARDYYHDTKLKKALQEHLTQYLEDGWEIVSVTRASDDYLAVVLQNSDPRYSLN
jgi:predicted GNAT superfamily acetyltransferase